MRKDSINFSKVIENRRISGSEVGREPNRCYQLFRLLSFSGSSEKGR
jgi:hypothetical protein